VQGILTGLSRWRWMLWHGNISKGSLALGIR
jgi:hypothetical protein